MPLQFTGAAIYDDAHDCVLILARDDDRGVRCAVSREALMDLSRVREASAQQLIAIYRDNAALVNAVALRKYDAGQIEASGRVLVTSRDLNEQPVAQPRRREERRQRVRSSEEREAGDIARSIQDRFFPDND